MPQPQDLFKEVDAYPFLNPIVTFLAEILGIPRWSGARLPGIWSRPYREGGYIVGIFNWGEGPLEGPWHFRELGLEPGTTYLVEDLWTGLTWQTTGDFLILEEPLQPHEVRLLKFLPLSL